MDLQYLLNFLLTQGPQYVKDLLALLLPRLPLEHLVDVAANLGKLIEAKGEQAQLQAAAAASDAALDEAEGLVAPK
jgi:hypothetical protein